MTLNKPSVSVIPSSHVIPSEDGISYEPSKLQKQLLKQGLLSSKDVPACAGMTVFGA